MILIEFVLFGFFELTVGSTDADSVFYFQANHQQNIQTVIERYRVHRTRTHIQSNPTLTQRSMVEHSNRERNDSIIVSMMMTVMMIASYKRSEAGKMCTFFPSEAKASHKHHTSLGDEREKLSVKRRMNRSRGKKTTQTMRIDAAISGATIKRNGINPN